MLRSWLFFIRFRAIRLNARGCHIKPCDLRSCRDGLDARIPGKIMNDLSLAQIYAWIPSTCHAILAHLYALRLSN